jgi:L-lysine 2,3-aminomutase
LLNQSVLLKKVNDDAEVLIALSERLLDVGVLPYYLHQLDEVTGTSHFQVDVEQGRAIIKEMRAHLPGYAVPRYVKEIAGQPNKTVLA